VNVLCRFKTPASSEPPEERNTHASPITSKSHVKKPPVGAAGGEHRATSPDVYYEQNYSDIGFTGFLQSMDLEIYAFAQKGIQELADQLSYVDKDSSGHWQAVFKGKSVGFESLCRTQYLINKYITRRKQGYKFDDLKREIFVVLEIEYCRDEHLPNDNGQWLEYLQILEEGNLVGAKAQFGKEGDMRVLPDAGDDHGNSPSPRPHASVGGTSKNSDNTLESTSVRDANWHPDKAKPKSLARRQTQLSESVKAKRVQIYQSLREQTREEKTIDKLRKRLDKRQRSPEKAEDIDDRASKDARRESTGSEITETKEPGIPVFEPSDTLKVDLEFAAKKEKEMVEQRILMYTEPNWEERWQDLSEHITTLTKHIVLLIENQPENFPVGSESVEDILKTQRLTAKLYKIVFDVVEKDNDVFQDLADQFKYTELAYEYLVIDVMNDDVDEAFEDFHGESDATPLDEWKLFLTKIERNINDTKKIVALRLGADLHTSPADASLDVMKNLTMRVQALQDW
jgi:hypothetical protein